jgi:hypothetical protein
MPEISLPKSNLYLEGSGLDKNGNKIVKISIPSLTNAFSIQTNGNLPRTGTILRGLKTKKDMEQVSKADLSIISKEVVSYIKKYGSELQKSKLRTYNS